MEDILLASGSHSRIMPMSNNLMVFLIILPAINISESSHLFIIKGYALGFPGIADSIRGFPFDIP